jgi:hypothetical protein
VLELIHSKSEPHKSILAILTRYSKFAKTPTLQQINVSHSLLGSLRNFCVCVRARDTLVALDNLIPTVCHFLHDSDNYEILFKSLSILRFLIKNCSTLATTTNVECIFADATLKRLEELACVEQHAGVRGELTRLVCQLPIVGAATKPVGNKRLYERLANFKLLIEPICAQLGSEHLIMLNESLLALNVLVTVDYS